MGCFSLGLGGFSFALFDCLLVGLLRLIGFASVCWLFVLDDLFGCCCLN